MLSSFWVLAWVEEYYDLSCAAGSVLSCALNLVVCDQDLLLNVNFEIVRYIVFNIVRKTYQFLCRIHGIVDARELKRECGPT